MTSEACFLLRNFTNGARNILALIERELILLPFDVQAESTSVKRILEKYQDTPMSLADACLVRLSEQISESVILTIDSDFKRYRKNKRDIIPVMMPAQV